MSNGINATYLDWELFPDCHTSNPKSEQALDKAVQIKMLNELKSSIEAFKPCLKHIHNSSFDNGKSNGLSIASSLIDGMIAKIDAG